MGRDVRLRGAISGTRSLRAKELVLKARSAREDATVLAKGSRPEDRETAVETLGRADSLLALAEAEDPRLASARSRAGVDRPGAERPHGRARPCCGHRARPPACGRAVHRAPTNAEALQLRGTLRWDQVTVRQGGAVDSVRLARAEADLRTAVDLDRRWRAPGRPSATSTGSRGTLRNPSSTVAGRCVRTRISSMPTGCSTSSSSPI